MNSTIRRELLLPQPREQVWEAITNPATLEQWMYPNDFEPRVGHHFQFHIPPNPKVGFDGLVVNCEVLECDPPSLLVFSWTVGGPVVNTLVSFQLEAEGERTRLFFEHSGFDLAQTGAQQAVGGAQYGWTRMLGQLAGVLGGGTSG